MDRGILARRLGATALVALLLVAAVLVRRSGLGAHDAEQELRALGWLAVPVFLAGFALGELLHLPGILFVVAARVVFGPGLGLVLGYGGALLAVTLSFTLGRFVVSAARATTAPWRPRWKLLRRAFDGLEAHPVRTVALLRLALWLTPPLSYALASSPVRARDHLVGSALGLVLPVLAAALLGGYLSA